MNYKSDWREAKQRFAAWWAHRSTGRPLLHLLSYRDEPIGFPFEQAEYADDSERYLCVPKVLMAANLWAVFEPRAEAMPAVSLNLGAGSMALYLGSEPNFREESVWFEPCIEAYDDTGTVSFDPENEWFRRHLDMYAQAKGLLAGTDILLEIPDIVENLDILSAMRGPQRACLDLYDHVAEVKRAIWKINDAYKPCYDAFYALCRGEDGGSAFTAFNIWGCGRTAKVQCDCSAMLSPGQFREFVQEPLREQCRWLDNSLFHLDGPECIRHLPALMEIEELCALQWTAGDGKPPAGEECWDGIWRQVKDAGKGMWTDLTAYAPDEAMAKADRLVRKFGGEGFYFQFPRMDREEADALLIKAEREWKC